MSPDEQAIRTLIEDWHRATAAGDLDTILELMDEDVVFLVPGQPTLRGRKAFEEAMRSVFAGNRINSSGDVQEIEVSGDLAYCWNHAAFRWRGKPGVGQRVVHIPQASRRIMVIVA